MDLSNLSIEELVALANEKRTAFDALVALDSPTDEDLDNAEALAADIEAISAEQGARTEREAQRAERAASLRTRFSNDEPVEEDEDEEEDEPAEEPAEEPVPSSTEPQKAAGSRVARLAQKTKRPPAPERSAGRVSITAAADVPEFSLGSRLDDLTAVAKALVNRSKGFTPPRGDGRTEALQKFGVASFRMDFPEDLTINRGSDDMEVLYRAADEKRLDGNSLVAAGGWCAPSETIYDLCAGETLDGMVSLPEVNVARGGINYTPGPDFADFYGGGFSQTEAEAIAGTAKTCEEVACPPFTEVRLDAVGLCIKVPILTNAAYPELTTRTVSGSMIAHQHRVNADVLGRMTTLAGAARVITGLGSTAHDTLSGLELLADEKREQYRLGLNDTLEVVVPFWVRGAVRSDLSARTGQQTPVGDEQINAHFRARNLNVQFVYDWQGIGQDAEVYPGTFNALMYPAGTFVKGTSDVINLSAVYDAASLAQNVYTGVFMEQGLLVAQMCYSADLITLPVCNAGRTGAADLTCAPVGP